MFYIDDWPPGAAARWVSRTTASWGFAALECDAHHRTEFLLKFILRLNLT